MKELYIKDLNGIPSGSQGIQILGWVRSKRHHGKVIFIDIIDSTGSIQIVVEKKTVGETSFQQAKNVSIESAISATGEIMFNNDMMELKAEQFEIISQCTLQVSPYPRAADLDINDPRFTDQLLLKRYLYQRHPSNIALMRFRAQLKMHLRNWFNQKGFIEYDAPVLTHVPLYEDSTAMALTLKGEDIFLTQCVGYYLEAAAHGLERVYNMGPSFRGEESRSLRHLMEYWHVKAEMCFGNLEDVIAMVEDIFKFLSVHCIEDAQNVSDIFNVTNLLTGISPPFDRISYKDAIKFLASHGYTVEFGKGLSSKDEELLSKEFSGPFWVTGIPRIIEPFPYCIDPEDPELTRTADLIGNKGYGELLGVAEKIWDLNMLDTRMKEKGKYGDPRYEWVREIHQTGCVPHIAFGMGLERLMRWILGIRHVRDCAAIPYEHGRRIGFYGQ